MKDCPDCQIREVADRLRGTPNQATFLIYEVVDKNLGLRHMKRIENLQWNYMRNHFVIEVS